MSSKGFQIPVAAHVAYTHTSALRWQERTPRFFVIQIAFLFSHLFIFLGIRHPVKPVGV